MSKARQIVVGMDTKGRYIVVSLSKNGIKVRNKPLHKISNVDEVKLYDANIVLSGSFLRKERAAKSLLAAFEDCLVLYESVKISGLTRVGGTVRVVLQAEEYLTGYAEYMSGVSRGLYSSPKPSYLSVDFHHVEEFLGEEDKFLKFCCEQECDCDYGDCDQEGSPWSMEELKSCRDVLLEDEEAWADSEDEDEEWSEEDCEDYCDECGECEEEGFEEDFEDYEGYSFMGSDEYEEESLSDEEDLEDPFETSEDLLSSLFPGCEVEFDGPDEFVTPESEEMENGRGTLETLKHSGKSKNKKKRKKNSGKRS